MTHRQHVSKEEAAAFQARIVELEAELAQTLTRAEAAEQEARELQSWAKNLGLRWTGENATVETRPVRLFHVADNDRPLYVVAHDWAGALEAWRIVIAGENDGILAPDENPLGIEHVCGPDELVVAPGRVVDLDQVVR